MITTHHGSAHNIPIPDSSVHLIVTSPPYYSLRKYSGDQDIEWPTVEYSPMPGLPPIRVQGCESGCSHVWGEPTPLSGRGGQSNFDSSTLMRDGRPEEGRIRTLTENAKELQLETLTPQGAYCQRCGGWRGALGLEPTIEMYIGHLILCLREWKRILRDDGTMWVNLGSSYANKQEQMIPARFALAAQADGLFLRACVVWAKGLSFCPDYAGSVMPESVRDRPTNSYEMVYMLAKSPAYYYDSEAVREKCSTNSHGGPNVTPGSKNVFLGKVNGDSGGLGKWTAEDKETGRNLRSVWAINPQPTPMAHFATYPEALVDPIIRLATSQHGVCARCGSPWRRVVERTGGTVGQGWTDHKADLESGMSQVRFSVGTTKDINRQPYQRITTGWEPTCRCRCEDVVPATVLDPFLGSGTTARVALRLGRRCTGVDLSTEYLSDLVPTRTSNVQIELPL